MSRRSRFARAVSEQLTDQSALQHAVTVIEDHIDLAAEGYRCQTRDLSRILVAAAAHGATIEATCNDLPDAPDSNTVRFYLNQQWTPEQVPRLEEQCNRALADLLPDWWHRQARRQPQEVAIDLHDEPYYGKADRTNQEHWICRGRARLGTTRFYRCATAYVMRKDVRVTLGVRFVHPGDDLLETLQSLLQQVKKLGAKISCLYLDKAFCTIPILCYLQSQTRLSVILAAPVRGAAGSGGGTRSLCQGSASRRSSYTFSSQQNGEVTVPVAAVRTRCRRRDGSYRTQWLVYVLLRVEPTWSLERVRQRYRRRFGIESSYRVMEQVRVRTTTNNAALRFLFMGLALILVNLWIALHWKYLQVRGSGPRRVARQHLTLERLARLLIRAVETIYDVISLVQPPGIKPVIY